MTNTNRRTAETLAYIAITGRQTGLHIRTRVRLVGLVSCNRSTELDAPWYVLSDEAMEIAKTSKTWKAHERMIAEGFHYDGKYKSRPSFMHYAANETSLTKSGREFIRSGFIGHHGAYIEQPSDETASGWKMAALS